MTTTTTNTKIKCTHCGDDCSEEVIVYNNHSFCCNGCKMVYQLLKDHGMDAYYDLNEQPGQSQKTGKSLDFDYLDDEDVVKRLIHFDEGGIAKVTLLLPQIHCSSCLWLLENLNKINPGILGSHVQFTRKKATITYRKSEISLRELVTLLTKIGYEPHLSYHALDEKTDDGHYDKSALYKLGLAGFAFGNIMLLSFPEYLGFHQASFKFYIGYINIALALPVLLYSGRDYLISAWRGIQSRNLNIDVPVALGMFALFGRSIYEILSQTGEGYLDSFAGFVFFLLIGRWFQSFTYKRLDFERNYKSYFPISTLIKKEEAWVSQSLDNIKEGDHLMIKNHELIPVDGLIIAGKARVDYSFVTGESDLISKNKGEQVLAGGRQMGSSIEMIATKKVDQSYLTQLWNEEVFKNREQSSSSRLIQQISKYFTFIVLAIAVTAFVVWYQIDPSRAFQVVTAVLIVACPCALALAIPFTYGNILRLLSEHGFYLRNVSTIEDIQDVDFLVFDKTGTITDSTRVEVKYDGKPLKHHQAQLINSACFHSSHPLSKAIVQYLSDYDQVEIDAYEDVIGSGLIARSHDDHLKLGSAAFIFGTDHKVKSRGVYVEINGSYVGSFVFHHELRSGAEEILNHLSQQYQMAVVSGDNSSEADRMKSLMPKDMDFYFNQKPKDKLNKIKQWQEKGHKVMMIGDGLNDAGALKQSQVGLVISDQVNNFSPACDAIVDANNFGRLHLLLTYLTRSRLIIYGAFFIAFLYNVIGLGFALSGNLSPVVAAILMPASSISVIVYGVGTSFLLNYVMFKKMKRT